MSSGAESVSLKCTVKPAVSVKPGDPSGNFIAGCKVVDVVFPSVASTDVGEIIFKNYYTAALTIKVRKRKAERSWRTCLRRVKLMPSVHHEGGSHDYFRFTQAHFSEPLTDVTGLRLILLQPSPVWKDFNVEEVAAYKTSSIVTAPVPSLPSWLISSDKKKDPPKDLKREGHEKHNRLPDAPAVEDVSAALQQMWALTEQTRCLQPSSSLGRYDVDGLYELNLLSYT